MDLKRLIATGALLLTSLIPKSAGSYAVKSADGTDSIHPLISSQLFTFLSNNSLLPEEVTFDLGKVKQGSVNEDSPEYDYTRSYNHFISWNNSNDGLWEFSSSKDWAMSPESQSGKIPFNLFPWPLSTFYQSLYPEDNPNYPHGDNSWPRVIEQYQGGEIGTAFGHIFHLICDTTVPAHTRMDTHLGEAPFLEKLLEDYYPEGAALWPTDIYEVWTDEHKFEIMNMLTPQAEKVPSPESLSELFKDLAYFTGSNFYSDGSVDGTVAGLTKVVEGNKKYFVKDIEGKKVHVLRNGFLTDFPDTICLKDIWTVQGTKSIEYGVAALNLLAEEQPIEPPECTNECDYGQTSCKDNQVLTCTNNDMDDCREWAVALYCGGGQKCSIEKGDCVEDVADCISFSSKACSGEDVYWQDSCGNLENFINTCASNTYCSNGNCVTEPPTCEDECENYNQTSCSGNKVMKCDYNNNTGCLELLTQENCNENEKCENGECKPKPTINCDTADLCDTGDTALNGSFPNTGDKLTTGGWLANNSSSESIAYSDKQAKSGTISMATYGYNCSGVHYLFPQKNSIFTEIEYNTSLQEAVDTFRLGNQDSSAHVQINTRNNLFKYLYHTPIGNSDEVTIADAPSLQKDKWYLLQIKVDGTKVKFTVSDDNASGSVTVEVGAMNYERVGFCVDKLGGSSHSSYWDNFKIDW